MAKPSKFYPQPSPYTNPTFIALRVSVMTYASSSFAFLPLRLKCVKMSDCIDISLIMLRFPMKTAVKIGSRTAMILLEALQVVCFVCFTYGHHFPRPRKPR